MEDPVVAEQEFALAVSEAIDEHKAAGHPIAVYKNGKAVLVDAKEVRSGRRMVGSDLDHVRREILEQMLQELPDPLKTVCRFYLILSYPCSEIAKLMSLETSAVQEYLKSGEQRLLEASRSVATRSEPGLST